MEKLTKRIKFGFGIGDLGGNLFFTIIGFYLLYFLTDVVHLSAALAGTVLMIGKIWDAITDPLTGYLSDRTRTRWGRRRPYMFIGSIGTFIGMLLLFTVPRVTYQTALFGLLTFYFCFLSTAYTLVNIPYTALLPELTDDFDQRTILTGYRMSFAVIGTFLGAGAVMPLISLFGGGPSGWSIMSGVLGAVMFISAFATILAVREPDHDEPPVKKNGFFKTYREALSLKVFLKALIPWALFITGTSMIQGALVYYFKYIYNNEGLFQIALLFLLTFSLAFIPVWVTISKKIGKKTCYNIGMGIMSVAVLLFSFLGEQLGPVWAFAAMAFGGIGLSTHYVMPHSILPDVVEYDSVHNHGLRREGVFSSMWTFGSKLGQALALALNGWLLSLFQYNPAFVPGDLTRFGIKIICGLGPLVFYVIGILILRTYPITKEYYSKMLETADRTV